MARMFLLAMALVLGTATVTTAQTDMSAKIEAWCQTHGYQPGTADYLNCIQVAGSELAREQAEADARRAQGLRELQAGLSMMQGAQPPPPAQITHQYLINGRLVTCITVAAGVTNCSY